MDRNFILNVCGQQLFRPWDTILMMKKVNALIEKKDKTQKG